jgi:uncharacterized protein (TIGR02147 family)
MSTKTLHKILNELQVTAYVDYRDFLAELYRRAKDQNGDEPYSYETFASDLGFSATNVIRLVIMRKRILATSSALVIVKALGLKHENRRYFLAMVRHVNARSPKLREQCFRKMIEAKQASILSHRDKDQLSFLSDWYHWVALEMLRLQGARPDPDWLSDQMTISVPPEKLRRSLALLESIGLLACDKENGQLRVAQNSPMLVPADEVTAKLAMTQHHQSMIENAKQALVKLPDSQREYDSLTLSLSKESFKEISEKVRQFCTEVMAIESREQTRECVAQLNVNMFSLSKWK